MHNDRTHTHTHTITPSHHHTITHTHTHHHTITPSHTHTHTITPSHHHTITPSDTHECGDRTKSLGTYAVERHRGQVELHANHFPMHPRQKTWPHDSAHGSRSWHRWSIGSMHTAQSSECTAEPATLLAEAALSAVSPAAAIRPNAATTGRACAQITFVV
jgi:hypothetical protein